MERSAEDIQLRRETLRLLAQVEKQGLDIANAYQSGHGVSGRYADFRSFIEKVDHFYIFIDLVEERLPRFEIEKRDSLEQHLADIRWRVTVIEVDTTQIFLVRIGESRQPLPLGSQQFLRRRLDRLGEIAAWYDRFGEKYRLQPLSEAMLQAIEDLLKAQIPKASLLSDFSVDVAATGSAPAGDLVRPDEISISLDKGNGRHNAERRTAPKPTPPPFRVREVEGRFYAERDGIVAVSEACRSAALTLDDLARQLGMSRPTLVLMLNGTDPLARGPLEEIRAFVARHGSGHV